MPVTSAPPPPPLGVVVTPDACHVSPPPLGVVVTPDACHVSPPPPWCSGYTRCLSRQPPPWCSGYTRCLSRQFFKKKEMFLPCCLVKIRCLVQESYIALKHCNLEQTRNMLIISGKFFRSMASDIAKVLRCPGGGSVLNSGQKSAQRSND